MPASKLSIALLGSTGSIGVQTLDIVRSWPESFEVATMTAHQNWQQLAAQAREFMPDSVVIADTTHYAQLKNALADLPIKIYAGGDAVRQVVTGGGIDVVINAIVGYAGLEPTAAALNAGKKVALANKESLVVAGSLLMRLSERNNAPVIPVDSEHSAIFQCLMGEVSPVSRLILTASGGPFLDTPAAEMENATAQQALRHPNWNMGPKISVDSATMLNKGFEVIEAHWLFGIEPSRIEVMVHPQSVIHSMVEFSDGSVKAQLGTPDMRLPIQYALTFPQRWNIAGERLDSALRKGLTFREPDLKRFPALGLAYDALRRGGNAGATLNAANEVAVKAFLDGRIKFGMIPHVIEHTLTYASFVASPTMDDYRESNAQAVEITRNYIENN